MKRLIVACCATWLVACDVTLRFPADDAAVDARADGTAGDACQGSGCGAECEGGSCTCAPPTSDCSGTCFNLKSDHNHCGKCTTACVNGDHCASGVCVAGGNGKDTGP